MAPRKLARLREVLAQGRIHLVEGVMARDQGEDATGFESIQGFGQEEIM